MQTSRSVLNAVLISACVLTFCVIGLGGFTRLIDAGLGCPDWPGCYGHLYPLNENLSMPLYKSTPFIAYKAWAEMVHRYFAGFLSLLIGCIFIMLFTQKNKTRGQCILALILFLLLIYQISLGQLTVSFKLLPLVVTQHLLGGFFILSLLWLMFLTNNKKTPSATLKPDRPLFFLGVGALILLFTQIFLGAWVSTNYAALSCPDFPLCDMHQSLFTFHFREAFYPHTQLNINYEGGVLSLPAKQTIQMTHRLVALIFTLYMGIFGWYVLIKLKNYPALIRLIYFIFVIIALQWCLGLINISLQLPLVTAVAHTLTAALLLVFLLTFLFKVNINGNFHP